MKQESTESDVYKKFTKLHLEGIYKAIYERRDIRSYRNDPIADSLLLKLLDAAHHAPSVGFMQPWNFIVIRNAETRKQLYDHFLEENQKASKHYNEERQIKYNSLKLQGILDAPINVLFTCDRTRGGEHVLGRSTTRDTDLYSTCLAIQNFWLAARAEGLGVGWMSIAQEDYLRSLLDIPEYVIPVAYMTLGYPVFFPETPLLESVGWRKRENLSTLIFDEKWNRPSKLANQFLGEVETSTGPDPQETRPSPTGGSHEISQVRLAQDRMDALTKPKGSLGRVEEIILKLAKIQNRIIPRVDNKSILLFAGDHGVTKEAISAYNPHVTAQMMYQYVAGGAAINSISRANQIDLVLCDAGVDHDFENASGIIHKKVSRGTQNICVDDAMTPTQADAARLCGRECVRNLQRVELLGLGEMGIGNTTASAAMASLLLNKHPSEVVGTGTGIGDKTRAHKIEIISRALLRKSGTLSPLEILTSFGGFEIAALVGAIEEAYDQRIPVILDGLITGVAALVATRMNPKITEVLFAGHLSPEPAHPLILDELTLKPILDLEMRLGEGSGAALAMSVVNSGCRIFQEMKTFEEANIRFAENEKALL